MNKRLFYVFFVTVIFLALLARCDNANSADEEITICKIINIFPVSLIRCENNEVICYSSHDNGLQCQFKQWISKDNG